MRCIVPGQTSDKLLLLYLLMYREIKLLMEWNIGRGFIPSQPTRVSGGREGPVKSVNLGPARYLIRPWTQSCVQ